MSSVRSVLFVCLGNICRSPLAEGIFKDRILRSASPLTVFADSAGLDDYHLGEPPDVRTLLTARRHGIQLNHRARVITPEDFEKFDYILAMDRSNLQNLEKLLRRYSPKKPPKIYLVREFDPEPGDKEVPDPYYGTLEDFEMVYQMLDRSITNFITFLRAQSVSATT